MKKTDKKPVSDRLQIGRYNTLEVVRIIDFGVVLSALDYSEVLLPKIYAEPLNLALYDTLSVFVYTDSEDRVVATTLHPRLMVKQIGGLRIVDVNKHGYFLDNALAKDIFAPFNYKEKEDKTKKKSAGEYLVIYMGVDKSGRMIGVRSYDEHIRPFKEAPHNIRLYATPIRQTPLGLACIVEGKYSGMLYKSEMIKAPALFSEVGVFIKAVRPDGRLDLTLHSKNRGTDNKSIKKDILARLEIGDLKVSTKSDGEVIAREFGVSKKRFKEIVNPLLKEGILVLKEGTLVVTK